MKIQIGGGGVGGGGVRETSTRGGSFYGVLVMFPKTFSNLEA